MKRSAFRLVAALAILAGAAPAIAQQRIGIDSAVNAQASATPPGGVARRVTIGEPVLFNERFTTDAGGQTQLLFLDQSAMTIGPDSDLTIDEFAYNPQTGSGRLTMSATRGLLRFVGGKLSKQARAVTLRTSSATLAVRGGAFLANLAPGGRLDVYFIYGVAVSVTGTNGVTQELRRPGFAITVARPGAAPSAPFRTPISALAGLLTALNGRPGHTGGAAHPPSQGSVVSSGISNVISGDLIASLAAAGATRPVSGSLPDVRMSDLDIATVQGQGTPGIALQEGNRRSSTNTTQSSSSETTAPKTVYPLAAFAAIDTATIFSGKNLASAIEPASATLQNSVLSAAASNAAVSIPLAPGLNNFGPQGTSSTFGAVTGTSYLAPDDAFFYAEGMSASEPGKIGVIVGGLPTINVPTTGIGSFSGSMTGLVDNNGAVSLKNGSFTNVYNFASQTGTFTISNFDGKSLSGSVSAVGKTLSALAMVEGITLPANLGNLVYIGSVTGSGLQGGVGGAFFGNSASDTGGAFYFKSPSAAYQAGGLFGGHR